MEKKVVTNKQKKSAVDKAPAIHWFISEVREAVADYMRTEGCSCCRDFEGHAINKERLARLLRVDKYSDDSGFDFSKYQSNK